MRRAFLAIVLLLRIGGAWRPGIPRAHGAHRGAVRARRRHRSSSAASWRSTSRQRLGQSFVVENRPAGSGIVGADHVAKSAPDGYTLLFAFSSLSSSAQLFSKLPYDPVRDFAPDRARHHFAASHRGAGRRAGEGPARVHRPRQGVAGKAELRLLGPGQLAAPRHRAFHVAHRRADGAHRVQGHRPGDHRAARERGAVLAGADRGRHAAREVGRLRALGTCGPQRSAATPDVPTAAEAGAAGARRDRVVGNARAGENAAGDRRAGSTARSAPSSTTPRCGAAWSIRAWTRRAASPPSSRR